MKTTELRPCPPNGLARAAWCRDFADQVSDERVRREQLACAEAIEARVFAALPLVALMMQPVGVALVPLHRPAAGE